MQELQLSVEDLPCGIHGFMSPGDAEAWLLSVQPSVQDSSDEEDEVQYAQCTCELLHKVGSTYIADADICPLPCGQSCKLQRWQSPYWDIAESDLAEHMTVGDMAMEIISTVVAHGLNFVRAALGAMIVPVMPGCHVAGAWL